MDLEFLRNRLSSKINPTPFENGDNKLASVLIVLHDKVPHLIMTEKPKTMNVHAGEISFPGGKWHSEDGDLLETALRETREELGLEISRNKVIGQLLPVTTLNSKFTILPFVTVLDSIPSLNPNSEVESILDIPFTELMKTLSIDDDPAHNSIQEMFTLRFEKHLIWGASARMLQQISLLLSNSL